MQFGSDNWDENDTTDSLNNALFGNKKKNVVKSNTTKKTAKQIDHETKQAKEFLQNFKSVQKTQKMVQFDVSDGESDDNNDLSKRAKKNLKERNRKKRKKELKRKENVKKKRANMDSDEELFAEIDEEDDRKQTKYVPEKSPPKIKNTQDVQISQKSKTAKKKKKDKIKEKISMGAENLPTHNVAMNETEKVANPFECKTQTLSKKQKKKLKKKEHQEKLALEMKKNSKKTENLKNNSENFNVQVKPLKNKTGSDFDLEGSSNVKLKIKQKFQVQNDSSDVTNRTCDIKVNSSNKVTNFDVELGSEGKSQKKKKSKVKEEAISNNSMKNGISNNVQNGVHTETVQKSKKKRKISESEGRVKTPEKMPKMDSGFSQNIDKNMQKNKVADSLRNAKSPKTCENENKQASKFNAKKLSNILSNKTCGVQTLERHLKDSTHKKVTKSLQERMKNQLNEARFRFLNEQLYTQTGPEAFSMFQEDEESFKVYHEGFQSQVSKWPVNPLDIIIKQVQKLPKTDIIADFGCGNADLAQSVTQKVQSFDLVPLNKYVTVCDISKVPLPTKSIDVAVFCLSLMGTNLNDYVAEANRVLKPGGELKIAEVESRIANTQTFITQIESFGFKLLKKETSHKMFHLFDFNKVKPCIKSAIQDVQLDPCIYKRR